MEHFKGELLGTMMLVLLGDGVVAGVLLARSKGHNAAFTRPRRSARLGTSIQLDR